MKKRKTLFVALAMIFSTVAAPALLLANDAIEFARAETASSIEDSNVWWDLYYMYKDAWLEDWNVNNPDSPRNEFNPYYLTPNYGDYRGGDSKGRLLCMYPYQNDMYIYTWLDTKNITDHEWDGSFVNIYGTTNTELTEDELGYDDSGKIMVYQADLVNTYGKIGDNSNWLGKWVIKDLIDNSDGNDAYRFYVEKLNLDDIREIAAGDELIYTKAESENDFSYQYIQPDYINITSKLGALMLSGEYSVNASGLSSFFKHDPNNAIHYSPDYPTYYDSSAEVGDSGYTNYDEHFYVFFNTGSYFIDSVENDESIDSIEEIKYSYVSTEYTHVSSQFVRSGWSNASFAFTGLYDKKYLHSDAYFTNVKKPTVSGDKVVKASDVTTIKNELNNVFWIKTFYEYSSMGIVDCAGDTNIPDAVEYKALKEFVKSNRSFDSDGDGIKDKQYRWAMKADTLKRTSETINYGTVALTSWGNWKTKAHQIDDITILKMKVINTDNHQFDLLAMDVNTPTTVVEVHTVGKLYVVYPKIIQDIIDFFNDNKVAILGVLGAVLAVVLLIVILRFLMPFITLASNASTKRVVKQNNKKKRKKRKK